MTKRLQVVWGATKLTVIDHIPQQRIEQAEQLVISAVNGDIGFCYKQVKRQISYESGQVNMKMQALKDELNSDTTLYQYQIDKLRERIANLKEKYRANLMWDERAYKQLYSNYKRLQSALELLHSEGYVKSYHISSLGRIKVAWWESDERITVEVIEQGDTFTNEQSYPVYTKPVKMPKDIITVANAEEHVFVKQGTLVKPDEGYSGNMGEGEYDPLRLKERDADALYHKEKTRMLYKGEKIDIRI